MKKILLIMMIGLLAILPACGQEGAPRQLEYDHIQLPFDTSVNEKTTVCYSDDEKLILSLWNKNKENSDSYKTTGIYMLNYMAEQENYTFYNAKSENVIYSALPYKEGILYVDYSFVDADGSKPIKWQIKYCDSQETSVIDEGFCSSDSRTPYLCKSEGVPVYFCEMVDDKGAHYTIRTVSELQYSIVEEITGYEPYIMRMFTNDTDYVIVLRNTETGEFEIMLATHNGIEKFIPLEKNLDSIDVSNSQIVCTLSDSDGNCEIRCFSLNQLDQKGDIAWEYYKPLYRVNCSAENLCPAVDSGFNPYLIDITNQKVDEFDLPEEYNDKGYPVAFYPAGESGYIVDIKSGNYFHMS